MAALRHGTKSGYTNGCRCERCRAWNAEKTRKYRASKTGAAPAKKSRAAAQSTTGATRAKAAAKKPDRIPGPVERDLAAAFKTMTVESNPWVAPLQTTALALAKAIDEAESSAVPRITTQLLDVLERLGLPAAKPTRSSPPAATQPELPGEEVDDTFVPSIGRFASPGAG